MKDRLQGRGLAVLAALDNWRRTQRTRAQVALAADGSPRYSADCFATSVQQLKELAPAASLKLTAEDMKTLDI
jgi:aryl-alcohol dehydrogenase-like predicted oxidoreductase